MVSSVLNCPECEHQYPVPCEQAVAIQKRGKCIACLIKEDGPGMAKVLTSHPYEFDYPGRGDEERDE